MVFRGGTRLTKASSVTLIAVSLIARAAVESPAADATEDAGIRFVQRYCISCHEGTDAEATLDLARFDSPEKIAADRLLWSKVLRRVRQGEMPPEDGEAPAAAEREAFIKWIDDTLRTARRDGTSPNPVMLRRLNRTEYAASIRDLLGIHINSAQALPSEGAGGEGFDNAAETLFVSPIHAEKYLDAARTALGYAFSDTRSQRQFLTAQPDDGISPTEAARQVLGGFLPRAFRRPTSDEEIEEYVDLFRTAHAREPSFNEAMQFALAAALVSPHFLFIVETPNLEPEPILLSDHELATRLSYFLWASTPDDELLRMAAEGKLNDDKVLTEQVGRMLGAGAAADRDSRHGRRGLVRVREFAQSFIEQWLGTRALGREFKPDPSIGKYDSELEGGMRYEPIIFFEEILAQNRSLLDLLDSDYTYANRRLARHYGISGEFREQPRRTELPENNRRGGVLGMASVLAVSSYPHRTSPVLRGKWILETLLGDPPPPPPPNVPDLEGPEAGEDPKSLRERLEHHRQNQTCAACHDRIDPLGFGLENYDVLGRWREEDAGHPIDARGQLPDGTEFDGPPQLKQVLLARKTQFIRHLTTTMLGYALARGLTNEDYCTVDEIVDQLETNDYSSHTLVLGIVGSVPFRYKAGANRDAKVKTEQLAGDRTDGE